MNTEVWQSLLGLESIDLVSKWHKTIFDRTLNSSRANEIAAAAKQGREYFRNASSAGDVVRPLLTYYGVASLARSALLLLKAGTGEASLTRGHGFETMDWPSALSGDLSTALNAVGGLRVRTCGGLFNDFLVQTDNETCMHIRSSEVDWRLNYPVPALGLELSLDDLLTRIPDLKAVLGESGSRVNFAWVNEITYTRESGFAAQILADQFEAFASDYTALGFSVATSGTLCALTCNAETFERGVPQFMHTYVNKTFGSIPGIHIARPLSDQTRLSQLGATFALSYFLGMLTRYFPTHWVSLQSGMKGDALWPSVRAAQHYVEVAFPEMVKELIQDRLEQAKSRD